MKYLFFGGKDSEFAEIIVNGLKEAGYPPLAEFRNAKAPLDPAVLASYGADFFLVASFAKILKQEIIAIPPKCTVGIHPSLLPLYRGASPIQSAILNGEKETGTALFVIDEKVDHGPVIVVEKMAIGDEDTYPVLLRKLARASVHAALEALPRWVAGTLEAKEQDHAGATFTKKFVSGDAEVDLYGADPLVTWRKIKALNPEPGTFAMLDLSNGKKMRLKLLEAHFSGRTLHLTKVQPEGKRAMSYAEFLNGYGARLSAPLP